MPHHQALSPASAPTSTQQPSSQEKTAAPTCHHPHRRFENKSNHFHELLLLLSSADTEWSWQFKHFTSKCSVNNGCTLMFLRGRLEEIKHSLKILHAFLTLRWIILLNLKINAWASFLCSNSVREKKNPYFVFLCLMEQRVLCSRGMDCWYVLIKVSLKILHCWKQFMHPLVAFV